MNQNAMVRTWLTVLGVGMAILWLVELSSPVSRALTWLDLVAAILSFFGAAATTPATDRNTRAGGTIALGCGVLALWLIGLVNGAAPWVSWWNFVFGIAYLGVGIAAARPDSGRGAIPFRRAA